MEEDRYIGNLKKAGVVFVENQPLSKYCTYHTGGPARIMAFPTNKEQLEICVDTAMPIEVIGFGSNVLCSDKGFNGVVINTLNYNNIEVRGATIKASCGAQLQKIREVAELNCLAGIEFTIGIPATTGGAICQNAGCFSKCIGDYVAYVVTTKGVYNNEQCQFAYRESCFAHKKGEVIEEVCFILKPGESDLIEAKREKFKKLRKNSQPHGKSCGSVFMNDGYFAGKVIDVAGLKGYSVGGAKVSEKHANFILNQGGSSADIYNIIQHIKEKVFETQNIKLKEELKYIGDFD